MSSGPTLNPWTLSPLARRAPISPVARVVLPTPEPVPAITTRALMAGWRRRSPLDPLLSADAAVQRVLDLAHLGDQVGELDQLGRRVTAGDHDVLETWPLAQRGHDVIERNPAPVDRIGHLVEQQELIALLGARPLDLLPSGAGELGRVAQIL